jgi:hypothetical protein
VILHVNHLEKGLAQRGSQMVAALLALVEQGALDVRLLSGLRVHLDWIQYRANFRDAVVVRRATDARGEVLALAEIAVDLRQADPAQFAEELGRALGAIAADLEAVADARVHLDIFTALRDSVMWRFNRLFWQRLADWEATTGRGFEDALPSGRSDANHPDAVADAVAEFWTLLRDLDKRGRLPAELFVLELGVGTGQRAALWLDRFQALDEERGTGYYPRLRFLLSDYSMPALDRALMAVQGHAELVSAVALDALDPLRTLAFLRYKLLYVHLTNVYDNLPADEVVRRDGRLYLVQARAFVGP